MRQTSIIIHLSTRVRAFRARRYDSNINISEPEIIFGYSLHNGNMNINVLVIQGFLFYLNKDL